MTKDEARIREEVGKRVDPGLDAFSARVMEIRQRASDDMKAAASDLCEAIMVAEGAEIIRVYGDGTEARRLLLELAERAARAALHAGVEALRNMFKGFGEERVQ